GLERADRRLAAVARPLHEHLDLLQPVLHAFPRRAVGGHLGGERRRLARALEPGRPGGLPDDDVPLAIGQRHDRVVERRLDVRLAVGVFLFPRPPRAAGGGGLGGGSPSFAAFFPRPPFFFGPLRVRAFVFARCPRTGGPRR